LFGWCTWRAVLIGIATCHPLPEPDPEEAPLKAALEARGARVEVVAWDVAAFDWGAVDACVLRSTWDYHRRPDAFLAWIDETAAATRLLNPPDVVRWNAHKEYLLELEAAGVPVVPTALLRRGDATTVRDVADAYGWEDVVVKPAVSAGSHATIRARRDDPACEAHLRVLLEAEDALVQCYMPSVEGHGERALVAIEGELTHAVRKARRLAHDDEAVEPVPIEADERALAESLLARFPRLLYARVDVAPDAHGAPCVMELELIEPSLFVHHSETALHRFADAIIARAR
jgi:glutathione synthase/RimK-type ligase-like ATP-grasp enzyme